MRGIIILCSLILLFILGYCNARKSGVFEPLYSREHFHVGKGILRYCDAEHVNTAWDLGRVIELNEKCLKIVQENKVK